MRKTLGRLSHWKAAFGICSAIAALANCIGLSQAGDLSAIRLKFEYVNDFAAGYDSVKNIYRNSYVRSVITEPVSRPVKASICNSLPKVQIVMTSTVDGKRCSPRDARLAPGAAAFVWTLRGRHPLLNTITVLQTIRRDLQFASRVPDANKCVPLVAPIDRVVPDSACQVSFNVPLRASPAASGSEQYTIRLEAVDSAGAVIETRDKDFGIPKKVPLIVSIGESFASGEGNPDVRGKSKDDNFDPFGQHDCEDDTVVMYALGKKPVMLKKPRWLEPDDHRSLLSGPALAAQDLLKDWPYVHFITLSKSGAAVLSSSRRNDIIDQVTDASELLGRYPIDVLLMSAGGNDAGFSSALTWLAKDFQPNSISEARRRFDSRLKVLRNNGYPALARLIASTKLNVRTIFISEYPNALFNDANGQPAAGCGIFDNTRIARISKADAVAITKMGNAINAQIADSARQFGWQFVTGITEQFARHGYCTSKRSYFRSAEDSCDFQGDFMGTMHPNEKGTAAYAKSLAAAMRKVLPKSDVVLGP